MTDTYRYSSGNMSIVTPARCLNLLNRESLYEQTYQPFFSFVISVSKIAVKAILEQLKKKLIIRKVFLCRLSEVNWRLNFDSKLKSNYNQVNHFDQSWVGNKKDQELLKIWESIVVVSLFLHFFLVYCRFSAFFKTIYPNRIRLL